MASSRLEKIGTIFSRVDGLIKANAMKFKERPLWYDLYKTFPPKLEPKYARPVPNIPIRNILYEEDLTRAKFHKEKRMAAYNLSDNNHKTITQKFLVIYNNLKNEGALSEDQIYSTALDMLESEITTKTNKNEESDTIKSDTKSEDINVNIKDIFN